MAGVEQSEPPAMRTANALVLMSSKRQHRRNYNDPGHAHELTFSCYHGFKFLAAERTCVWLSEAIEEARKKLDFQVWAYVIMPEHVHLIVCSNQPIYEIAEIRKAIKAPVATRAIRYLSGLAS